MSDAFNLQDAVLTPRAAADWPATAEITSLTFTSNGLSLEFTKKAIWPNVVPPGWNGPIEFTVWFGTQVNGQWRLAASLNCWRGEAEPFGGPVTDATHYGRNLWYLDPALAGVPASGPLAVMVTSGAMRGVNAPGPAERSNVVLVPFSRNDATFTFGPTTAPVTAPVPLFAPVPPAPTAPAFDPTPLLEAVNKLQSRLASIELKLDALAIKPPPQAPNYVGSVFGSKVVLKPSV